MMSEQGKQGRPRRYNFAPISNYTNADAAVMVGTLDELSDRVFDLIEDLSDADLQAKPGGVLNSIQMLVSHMTWSETTWFGIATGEPLPPDLASIQPGDRFPVMQRSAADLIEEARNVREGYTKPLLSRIADIDAVITAPDGQSFPRGVDSVSIRGLLMHYVWHWTYHGGQIGLIRRMLDRGYVWTMDPNVTGPTA